MNENKKTSAKVVAAALSNKGNRRGNRPRLSQYPGLQVQRHMRTTGPKTYYYHRTTGTRIEGEPGTAEFEANWEIAQAKAPKVFHKLKWKRRKSRKDGDRYVYFVQCDTLRHIKIGASQHPWTRFINIQTSCPDSVTLLGVILEPRGGNLERELQHRFGKHRIRGEWYAENDELVALIQEFARPAEQVRIRYDLVVERTGAKRAAQQRSVRRAAA